MAETFVLLLAAHVFGDFVFQSDHMVRTKRNPLVLLLHAAIHLGLAIIVLGTWHIGLVALIAAHLVIDLIKVHACPPTLRWFLADQAAHLGTVAAAAVLMPGLWSTGCWSSLLPPQVVDLIPQGWLYLSGLIVATRAGGIAVGLMLQPYLETAPQLTQGSLPGAGKLIGELERLATFLLILLGQPTAVAFLVAAKSVLRFETARDDRKISEYIIAGTLASIGWALLIAILVQALAGSLA